MADLLLGHPPVETGGDDEVDVLDPRVGRDLDDLLQDQLAGVRLGHRRQRQREIVERERQLHARAEQRLQRIVLQRVRERSPDRPLNVSDRLHRVGRIDHAAAQGQLLQPHALAEVEEDRGRVAIDLEYGARPTHRKAHPSGT